MMFKTHLVFGFLIALLALKFLEVSNKYFFIAMVLFASVIPDLDIRKSKVSRKTWPFSRILNFLFKHRGFIHSIWPPILIFLVFNKSILGFAFFIGYFSHLIIDGLTKEGIALFQPVFKIKLRGFIKTNSFFENVFFILILFLSIYMLVRF